MDTSKIEDLKLPEPFSEFGGTLGKGVTTKKINCFCSSGAPSIEEQIQGVLDSMKKLVEDINNTDVEYFDEKQLKDLRDFSKDFTVEIQEKIYQIDEWNGK